jgi:hypothetical protein
MSLTQSAEGGEKYMHDAQMKCAGDDLMPTLEEILHSNLYFGRFDLLFY